MVSVISTGVSLLVIVIVYGVFHVVDRGAEHHLRQLRGHVPLLLAQPPVGLGQERAVPLRKEVRPSGSWRPRHRLLDHRRLAGPPHRPYYKLGHLEPTALVLGANVLSFALFWVVKLLIFNRLFKVELEEFDEHLAAEESSESRGP